MFIQELTLYVEYLRKEFQTLSVDVSSRTEEYYQTFIDNLHSGMDYYRGLAEEIVAGKKKRFLDAIETLQHELESLPAPAVSCGPCL